MHRVSEVVHTRCDGEGAPAGVRASVPAAASQSAGTSAAGRRGRGVAFRRAGAAAPASEGGEGGDMSRAGFGQQVCGGIGKIVADRGQGGGPVTSYLPARSEANLAKMWGLGWLGVGRSWALSRASFGVQGCGIRGLIGCSTGQRHEPAWPSMSCVCDGLSRDDDSSPRAAGRRCRFRRATFSPASR